MSAEQSRPRQSVSTAQAVRHHLVLVVVFVVLGAVAGWLYGSSQPPAYTSTARVLINPSVGNPFVPTSTSVRTDELTSLETEAQVAHSEEVLATVAKTNPSVSTRDIERGLEITVPPNTQILEISFTAGSPVVAQAVAGDVARAYLDNRSQRFENVKRTRIRQVQVQTDSVVTELRAATAAAVKGSDAEQLFHSQLATALRNQLVSLRAQRTGLESSESPAGAVISPATVPQSETDLLALAAPMGGAFLGLALGCLIAVLRERSAGVVRSAAEVEAIGVNVVAAVPQQSWFDRLRRRDATSDLDTTIRRLRSSILEQESRPDVVTVTSAGAGRPDVPICEAVAESFAKAGHRVVLVRSDERHSTSELVVEEGLAQALLHERLNVLDLLQPTADPLLSVLPSGGFTAQSREFLIGTRVRTALAPLVKAGNLVVIQASGIDSADGEAMVGAADVSLVVVTTGRTRVSEVQQVAQLDTTAGGALVVGRNDATRRVDITTVGSSSYEDKGSSSGHPKTRVHR